MTSNAYESMAKQDREKLLAELMKEYSKWLEADINLDMSRGKPSPAQLELSTPMLLNIENVGFIDEKGFDSRNYGELRGVREMARIFASMLDVDEKNVICGGNSSLNLMYDTISRAYTHGLPHSDKPWCKYDNVKFLCPVPGYDRHFAVTEHFGIEMINVPMTPVGPDMDIVERLVASDETIKGMWNIPVFQNPTGYVYSDETIKRLAYMECAAPDFTLIWDNAYSVHPLYKAMPRPVSILDECANAGNPERVILFASTSKITFSGAGVACIAGSEATLDACVKSMSVMTIGYDKLNQLVHARFLKNEKTLRAHMQKQAEILAPKFELVDSVLKRELSQLNIARWTNPLGGYFMSLFVPHGCAKRVVKLCADANVKLTGAGAAYPYKNDPEDSHIRIAPSYPSLSELEKASELLCLCTKIAALEVLERAVD